MEKIKIYTTPECPYCHRTRNYLKNKNIEFEDINVSNNREKVEEMIGKSGQMGVPVLDIGGKIIVGFDTSEIESALKYIGNNNIKNAGSRHSFNEDEIDKKKVHFDTRQYNYIAWETINDLKKRLVERVKATINSK